MHEISNLSIHLNKPEFLKQNEFKRKYEKELSEFGRIFLIYKNDSLISWSDNSSLIPSIHDKRIQSGAIIFGGNGYYQVGIQKTGLFTIYGLQLIKNEYRYKNDYLPQGFYKKFNAPKGTEISLKPSMNNIIDAKGNFLFSISTEESHPIQSYLMFLIFTLYVTSFLCLISALFTAYRFIMKLWGHRVLLLIFFVLDVLLLRAIQFYFQFPSSLYSLELFNPVYFAASDWLPSLGDLLINSALFLQITYFLFKYVPSELLKNKRSYFINILAFILCIGALLALFEILYSVLRSLILNSSIPLQFYNILSLSEYSFAALFVIGVASLSFILLAEKLLNLSQALSLSKVTKVTISLTVLIIYIFWNWNSDQRNPMVGLFLALFIIIGLLYQPERKISLIHSGRRTVFLLILALIGTYYINVFVNLQELEQRKIVATHLAESRDKLAEYYYKLTINRIHQDKQIPLILEDSDNDSQRELKTIEYIQRKYFQGFWSKYHIQLTLCHPGKKLNINAFNQITECDIYFNDQIDQYLSPVDSSGLFFLNQSIDQTYYLGKTKLRKGSLLPEDDHTLYIEIDSRNASRGQGYPELLMDLSSAASESFSRYSYAFYNNNDLIRSVGKYSYSTENSKNLTLGNQLNFFYHNGYSHLIHKIDSHTTLIISKEKPGIADILAPFSYLFLTLLLLMGIIMIFAGKSFIFSNITLTFRVRLQIYIIAIILISSIIIGGVTLIYLNQLNFTKNKDIVNEKMNTVLVELENRYGNSNILNENLYDDLNVALMNLSNTNFTDINLFGLDGRLLASSREQIFDEGLISDYMNPSGLSMLLDEKRSFYIQKEKIGRYNYLSAYAPLRNFNNQLIGYLNLPYFSRQEDLRQEMSRLLATYANLYIMMIAIAVLLAVIISRYITRPLQLIRNQLGKIQLGRTNAKIVWKREDEIGDLVAEYNRMIDELSQSAELLARSEREIAWREMARQVAHEIKNPLTPIKLSMQHLIKAWDDHAPDWENRLKRFSQTLILQIDTLSAIASEFSDFAQMPRSNFQIIDIQGIISSSAQLFRDLDNVSIHYPAEANSYFVYADENQMLRVFNNLIKNSIQAIPQGKEGHIQIELVHENNQCLIKFTDNGSGIPNDQQTKIFSPNFTTKSAGMGLGLAMVKNIIDNSRGKIWFDSHPEEGTTFYILLPIAASV
ncbi:MAG: HAMP domain-containing protein [Bacteroidales bacterium]|nr:HAMP domain-containing protein [Bacteroidales bacterium]